MIIYQKNLSRGSVMAVLCVALIGLTFSVSAIEGPTGENGVSKQKINTSTKPFSVKLAATRVIFDPESNGASLKITNPQSYPILVQSTVVNEDMETKAPFMVTPPLFRLDGNQQTRIRIVRTGGKFPEDRETLQWVCVKGVPPKAEDTWAEDKDGKTKVPDTVDLNVQLAINNCIKMLVRPKGVTGQSTDGAASVTWQRRDKILRANNPTPFYMNLDSLKVGDTKIPMLHYLPPFSSYDFELPPGSAGRVQWSILGDIGEKSRTFEAPLK